MSGKSLFLTMAALVFSIAPAQAQHELKALANFHVNFPDDELDSFGSDGGYDQVNPSLSAAVNDGVYGKASADAFASYGVLKSSARIDPDIDDSPAYTAYGETFFFDTLTITGNNVGEPAQATFKFHVSGLVQQPFIVSEVTGYATAHASLSAGSPSGGDFVEEYYNVSGFGGPLYNPVNDTLSVTIDFLVGDEITLSATLDAIAEANGINVLDEEIDFAALFGSTGTLLPIEIGGVENPVINSASGTSYAFVPEPAAMGVVLPVALAMRRRRG